MTMQDSEPTPEVGRVPWTSFKLEEGVSWADVAERGAPMLDELMAKLPVISLMELREMTRESNEPNGDHYDR